MRASRVSHRLDQGEPQGGLLVFLTVSSTPVANSVPTDHLQSEGPPGGAWGTAHLAHPHLPKQIQSHVGVWGGHGSGQPGNGAVWGREGWQMAPKGRHGRGLSNPR